MRRWNIGMALGAVLVATACHGGAAPAGPSQAAGTYEAAEDLPNVRTSMVSAAAVVSACPDGKRMNGKLAARTIQDLVDPCATVPGGRAHFSVALLPGGKIQLAAPDGNAAEGIVPTCVLKNGLQHKVHLTQACKFDVQLEERKAGSGPS